MVNIKLCILLNILINCCYIDEENLLFIELDNIVEVVFVYVLVFYVGNESRLK